MKVTKEDIQKIKPGRTKQFICDTPLAAKSGQSMVSYVKKFCPVPGVKDYQTCIDGSVLAVTAIGES